MDYVGKSQNTHIITGRGILRSCVRGGHFYHAETVTGIIIYVMQDNNICGKSQQYM